MNFKLFLRALVFSVLASHAPAQLTAEQYADDLTYMLEAWLPNQGSLDESGKAEVRLLLEEARRSAEDLDDVTFSLVVMRAQAVSRNGHDMMAFGLFDQMPRLPIRIWWFSDGLYVVKADEEHADLVGSRIDLFGVMSPDAIMEAAAHYLPGNAAWQRHRSIEFLTRLPLLAGIGAMVSPSEIAMRFTTSAGDTLHRTLEGAKVPDPENDAIQPWKESLQRFPGDDEGVARWAHALDSTSDRPAYLRRADNVRSERLEDLDALYVRIASIRNIDGPGSLQAALADITTTLEHDPPSNLILDLRYNTGGNFFNVIPFAYGVGILLPKRGRIFLLCNRCTFSAAIVTMALIKHEAGADRITIVGEPIGDRLRFWSEGGNVILPNSKFLVTHRDGLHDMIDGCQPDEGCWWGAEAFEHGVGELNPDIEIRERFEDYASGRDLYLEAVGAELKKAGR